MAYFVFMSGLPSYQICELKMENAQAVFPPAEAHGLLCGMLCGEGSVVDQTWQDMLFNEGTSHDLRSAAHSILTDIYQHTLEQLNDSNLGFELMVQQEDADLFDQVNSIAAWCHGFLHGFSRTHTQHDKLPEEVQEMLNDLGQIALADVDEEDGDAEDSVMQIIEYIRVGVLFILETMQPLHSAPKLH